MKIMDIKKVFFLMFVSSLLISSTYATSDVTSFNINDNYKQTYNDSYHALYLNENHDAGVTVYKNVDEDQYYIDDNDEKYDNLIEDDGREYLHSDDDYQLQKNEDKTASFKDHDNNEHGIVELIKNNNGQEYIVVFWAKNNNDMKNKDLKLQLEQFNKDNNVNIITFNIYSSFSTLFYLIDE